MQERIGPIGLWAIIGAGLLVIFGVFIDDALLAAGSWASSTARDPLSVSIRNSAGGTIVSTPPGIRCGNGSDDCSAAFPRRTAVELKAEAAPNYRFDGWGGDCERITRCIVQMRLSKSVTATFSRVNTLTVHVAGPGSVRDGGAAINCGMACASTYNDGETVTLYASAAPGSRFEGWSGACAGAMICTVRMDDDKAATATFIPQ